MKWLNFFFICNQNLLAGAEYLKIVLYFPKHDIFLKILLTLWKLPWKSFLISLPSNVTVWNSPSKSWLKNVNVFPESVRRTGRGEGGHMQILTPSLLLTGYTPGDVKLQATSLNCCNVVCYVPLTTNSCWSYWYYWVVNFKWWTYAW